MKYSPGATIIFAELNKFGSIGYEFTCSEAEIDGIIGVHIGRTILKETGRIMVVVAWS